MILNLEITNTGPTEVLLSQDYYIKAIKVLRSWDSGAGLDALWMQIPTGLSQGHIESSMVSYDMDKKATDASVANAPRVVTHNVLLIPSAATGAILEIPCNGYLSRRFTINFFRARSENTPYVEFPTKAKPLYLVLEMIEDTDGRAQSAAK